MVEGGVAQQVAQQNVDQQETTNCGDTIDAVAESSKTVGCGAGIFCAAVSVLAIGPFFASGVLCGASLMAGTISAVDNCRTPNPSHDPQTTENAGVSQEAMLR